MAFGAERNVFRAQLITFPCYICQRSLVLSAREQIVISAGWIKAKMQKGLLVCIKKTFIQCRNRLISCLRYINIL